MWPTSLLSLRHPSIHVPQFLSCLDQLRGLISESAAKPRVLSEDLSPRLFLPDCSQNALRGHTGGAPAPLEVVDTGEIPAVLPEVQHWVYASSSWELIDAWFSIKA